MALDAENVTMYGLRAYDTTTQYGYIATLAYTYIPSNDISLLKAAISNPDSHLYRNQNPSTNSFMSAINLAIPVENGTTLASNSTTSKSLQTSTPSIPASSSLSPSARTLNPTSKVFPTGLDSGSNIGSGIVVPIAVIALLSFGLVLWRRRRYSRNKAKESEVPENDIGDGRYEAVAEAKKFALQVGDHEHEMHVEERAVR